MDISFRGHHSPFFSTGLLEELALEMPIAEGEPGKGVGERQKAQMGCWEGGSSRQWPRFSGFRYFECFFLFSVMCWLHDSFSDMQACPKIELCCYLTILDKKKNSIGLKYPS